MTFCLNNCTAMMQETAASCTPSPEVTLLRSIFDVKSWLSPVLENLHGHSTPHCFKFLLGTSGRALMFFKLWSHDPWCDDKDAVVLLKVNKATNANYQNMSSTMHI